MLHPAAYTNSTIKCYGPPKTWRARVVEVAAYYLMNSAATAKASMTLGCDCSAGRKCMKWPAFKAGETWVQRLFECRDPVLESKVHRHLPCNKRKYPGLLTNTHEPPRSYCPAADQLPN